MERNYSLMMGAGPLILAEELAQMEQTTTERRRKKERVVQLKRDMLFEAFPEETAGLLLKGDAWKLLTGERSAAERTFVVDSNGECSPSPPHDAVPWPKDEAITFIIDLAFANPFAPYELQYRRGEFKKGLGYVGQIVGLEPVDVERVLRTQDEALKAHHHIDWARITLFGIGGLIVLGVGGWLLAPGIGMAIGAAAGLSGAAATSHGLAILGGGSLAAGGAGMAGGMWLVTSTGAAIGILSSGGATLLLQLGAANARIELTKLQVSYKELILGNQMELKKAQEVIKSLSQRRDEILQRIEEERELNEANAGRLKDMEETLRAVEESLRWMKKAEAPGKQGSNQTANSRRSASDSEEVCDGPTGP